jgi:hypothetical protein
MADESTEDLIRARLKKLVANIKYAQERLFDTEPDLIAGVGDGKLEELQAILKQTEEGLAHSLVLASLILGQTEGKGIVHGLILAGVVTAVPEE